MEGLRALLFLLEKLGAPEVHVGRVRKARIGERGLVEQLRGALEIVAGEAPVKEQLVDGNFCRASRPRREQRPLDLGNRSLELNSRLRKQDGAAAISLGELARELLDAGEVARVDEEVRERELQIFRRGRRARFGRQRELVLDQQTCELGMVPLLAQMARDLRALERIVKGVDLEELVERGAGLAGKLERIDVGNIREVREREAALDPRLVAPACAQENQRGDEVRAPRLRAEELRAANPGERFGGPARRALVQTDRGGERDQPVDRVARDRGLRVGEQLVRAGGGIARFGRSAEPTRARRNTARARTGSGARQMPRSGRGQDQRPGNS